MTIEGHSRIFMLIAKR